MKETTQDGPADATQSTGDVSHANGSGWRRDVQGLRGLSMLIIVAYHAGLPIPGGFVALDVFFVVSGFVITGMILRERERTSNFDLRAFYLRRLKRLTPALLVTVSIVLLLCVVFSSPLTVQDWTAYTGLGAVFFSANAVVQATTGDYFAPWTHLNPLMHTWSLSLEEQFYLLFPVLLALAWFVSRRFRVDLVQALVSLVFTSSLYLALFGTSTFDGINPVAFGYYSPLARSWEFAAGALLAFRTQGGLNLSRTWAQACASLGLLLLLVPLWAITSSVQYPGVWTLAPVTGTVLLILAGFNAKSLPTRALSSRAMVYVGDRSYSWYLWHWPIIVFAVVTFPLVPLIGVIGAVASIGPALCCYWLVESKSRSGTWTPKQTVVRSLAIAGITISIAAFVLFGSRNGWWLEPVRTAQIQVGEDHLAFVVGCHTFEAKAVSEYDDCWLNQTGQGTPIFLTGDSTADALSDAFVMAGQQLDRPVNVVSASSCPFITSPAFLESQADPRCAQYIRNTLTWLGGQSRMLVVISTSGSSYEVNDGRLLAETILQIQGLGHDVAVIKPLPQFVDTRLKRGGWDPAACGLAAIATRTCKSELSVSKTSAFMNGIWRGAKAATDQTGSHLIDLSPEVCPQGNCLTTQDGRWVFRDFNHITANESRRLAATLVDLLAHSDGFTSLRVVERVL